MHEVCGGGWSGGVCSWGSAESPATVSSLIPVVPTAGRSTRGRQGTPAGPDRDGGPRPRPLRSRGLREGGGAGSRRHGHVTATSRPRHGRSDRDNGSASHKGSGKTVQRRPCVGNYPDAILKHPSKSCKCSHVHITLCLTVLSDLWAPLPGWIQRPCALRHQPRTEVCHRRVGVSPTWLCVPAEHQRRIAIRAKTAGQSPERSRDPGRHSLVPSFTHSFTCSFLPSFAPQHGGRKAGRDPPPLRGRGGGETTEQESPFLCGLCPRFLPFVWDVC